MIHPKPPAALSPSEKALLLWQTLGVSQGEVEQLLRLCPSWPTAPAPGAQDPPQGANAARARTVKANQGAETAVVEEVLGRRHLRSTYRGNHGLADRSAALAATVARVLLLMRARDALQALAAPSGAPPVTRVHPSTEDRRGADRGDIERSGDRGEPGHQGPLRIRAAQELTVGRFSVLTEALPLAPPPAKAVLPRR